MDRRAFLIGCGSATIGAAFANTHATLAGKSVDGLHELVVQDAAYRIKDDITNNMVSLSPDSPPPVLRLKQHSHFVANVTNNLDSYTAMHWHGIRVPNKMDGVPYLTQWPIAPGEIWRYAFSPEDAGTYWYHPHCMTMEQMARGLTGVLVVEETDPPAVDGETILNLRDFRLGSDGQFLKLFSKKRAARGGTLGTLMTANWAVNPVYEHRAGSLVRLRIVATDMTRIYRLSIAGGSGRIIAVDGHPIRQNVQWPTAETPHAMGPGQRIDLLVQMPTDDGAEVEITHGHLNRKRVLARLKSVGTAIKRDIRSVRPLEANPIPEPDLKTAQVKEFVFGWTPQGEPPSNGHCGSLGVSFWSINRQPWPGGATDSTVPLAELKLGKSYVLRFRNESPNMHPIHLHGLTFRPIRSNMRKLPSNWTDTVLLMRNETVDVALVASNPGDWAFHCHVIEHQKTGLAGFLRIT